MNQAPVVFEWTDDGVMRPLPRFTQLCDRQFVVHETYCLVVEEERSAATHSHQFAWLHEAWKQLPEDVADLYPTATHLRKRALIEAGFYNETVVDAGSNAAALRVASTLKARDEFALVTVRGPLVVIRDAKSQSRRAMKRAEFQDSKQKIMEIVAGMIGVAPEELAKNAGKAA